MMASAELESTALEASSTDDMRELEQLFLNHMRARVMLRDVVQAEKDALSELVWMLKRVPKHLRQDAAKTSVELAAATLVFSANGN